MLAQICYRQCDIEDVAPRLPYLGDVEVLNKSNSTPATMRSCVVRFPDLRNALTLPSMAFLGRLDLAHHRAEVLHSAPAKHCRVVFILCFAWCAQHALHGLHAKSWELQQPEVFSFESNENILRIFIAVLIQKGNDPSSLVMVLYDFDSGHRAWQKSSTSSLCKDLSTHSKTDQRGFNYSYNEK